MTKRLPIHRRPLDKGLHVKGNVSVITGDPQSKDGNARSTTISLNKKCGRY